MTPTAGSTAPFENILISRCFVFRNLRGVQLYVSTSNSTRNLSVADSILRDNRDDGIEYTANGAAALIIARNIISGNTGHGLGPCIPPRKA